MIRVADLLSYPTAREALPAILDACRLSAVLARAEWEDLFPSRAADRLVDYT
jgi:hypothetical protein